MQPSFAPESLDDVAYAATKEGFELPVLDVTHRRFAIPEDPEALRALHDKLIASERRRRLIPQFIFGMMLRSAMRQSRLVRALFGSGDSYLDGISTYVMKLGGDNLVPPYDSPVDRRFASSPHLTFVRLRTQQTASLLAEGLSEDLAQAASDAPLHFINIAGGPAMDSLNALILLARADRRRLQRKTVVNVLDLDEDGAFFGRNALAALQEEGRPLAGLDIEFRHQAYDWNMPSRLEAFVGSLVAQGAVIAASSEGGLFEYGSDEAIVSNLKALGTGVPLVVGSVTRADETRRRLVAGSRFKLIMRGLEGFSPLAAKAGYSVAAVRSTVWSDQVLLRPA
jgi:hypothetical protein